jgi:hypothetical protein
MLFLKSHTKYRKNSSESLLSIRLINPFCDLRLTIELSKSSRFYITAFNKKSSHIKRICGYYFEMSHLITNLKCHIGKLSSKNYRRIGDGKNIDYGGRVEET